jgi:uncharacterized small protein (DUF1192 family)
MAIYTLENETSTLDENVRIKKVETKEVESFVSVADLKQRHSQLLEEIERIKVEADSIVDQITEIDLDEGIDLTIKEIPTKLIEKLIK